MIDAEGRDPLCISVTAGAIVRAGDVRDRFPGGGDAVMTRHARRGCGGVIETSGDPNDADVASVAGGVGWYVMRRLTVGMETIVAIRAGCGYRAMVEKTEGGPPRRGVANVAFDERRDMVDRFSARDDPVMAAGAIRWCIVKTLLDVARFAVYKGMGVSEWESRL